MYKDVEDPDLIPPDAADVIAIYKHNNDLNTMCRRYRQKEPGTFTPMNAYYENATVAWHEIDNARNWSATIQTFKK